MRDTEREGNGAENALSSHAKRDILELLLSNMQRQVVDCTSYFSDNF